MSDLVTIERTCWSCHTDHLLAVTAQEFRSWNLGQGAHVDEAFPRLSDDERELLISGLCGTCFDAMAPGADTEPGADGDEDEDDEDDEDDGDDGDDDEDAGRAPGEGEDDSMDASTTGRTVDGPTPAQCVERALLGLTAEGEPAVRGALLAPSPGWPRCGFEIPALDSPIFRADPNICDRPATLLMGFTAEYAASMSGHRCGDPDCPIAEIGADPTVLGHLQLLHVPVCALHLPQLQRSEREWVRQVGAEISIERIYRLAVIGVESVSMLGGGSHPLARVLDLRTTTGVALPEPTS